MSAGGRAAVWGRRGAIGVGALAGLVAALAMTLFMSLTRVLLGIPTPAELIGDTFIPNLSLDQFFALIGRFGGGNGIKMVGIGSVLLGEVVAGVVAGGVYGAISAADTGPRRGGVSRRGLAFVVAAGTVAWLATIVPLRGVLVTNYRGVPAGPATALSVVGILLTYALFGTLLVLIYRAIIAPRPVATAGDGAATDVPIGRRVLLTGGVALAAAVATGGRLAVLHGRSTLRYDGTRYRGADVRAITPNDRFYSVTKNILDPDVARAVWRLRVDGRVARPRTYTFEELAALPGVTTQEATISCISNDVGDGLASNAIWKGLPLRALLEAAGVEGSLVKVVLHAADNYIDTILPDKALDPTTFVAWEMNGTPLPQRHGYPVRMIVPGRFGEKSVKWLTRIEVVDRDVKGFYERQGWGPTFTIPPYSRFDAPTDGQALRAGTPTRLHGIAFAGDRGISRVEVSADDGRTWQQARFDHQTTKIAWTLWSLDWQPPAAGEYRLAVRATDGTGMVQTAETRGIVPDGATGLHRIGVRVA